MARAPAHSTPETALTPLPLHPSHPQCPTRRRDHLAGSIIMLKATGMNPDLCSQGEQQHSAGLSQTHEDAVLQMHGCWRCTHGTPAAPRPHPQPTQAGASPWRCPREEDAGLAAVPTPLVARRSWSPGVITWRFPCPPIDEEQVEHVHQTVYF